MLTKFRQRYPQYDDVPDTDLIPMLQRALPPDQLAALTKENEDEGREEEGGRQEVLAEGGGEIPRPTHDDLEGAAVTGADSLELQEIAPDLKPVVKMTISEAKALKLDSRIAPTKVFWPDGKGNAFVIDKRAVQGIYGVSMADSIFQAKKDLRKGGDAESLLLGYPKRDGLNTIDMAVTKSGDIVHDMNDMKMEAEAGNVAWAAEGEEEELQEKAAKVSSALKHVSARAKGGPVENGEPYLVGEEGPEIVIPSQNGSVVPANDTSKIMDILNNNKNKNFVQRIMSPKEWPTLDLGRGDYATHKMAYSTNDDGSTSMVYPHVVYVPTANRLMELKPKDAYGYAKRSRIHRDAYVGSRMVFQKL